MDRGRRLYVEVERVSLTAYKGIVASFPHIPPVVILLTDHLRDLLVSIGRKLIPRAENVTHAYGSLAEYFASRLHCRMYRSRHSKWSHKGLLVRRI